MRFSTPDGSLTPVSLALMFAAAVVGGAIWANRSRAASVLQSNHHATDKRRDETLQDSFPASDAPATRDYAIPVNAR